MAKIFYSMAGEGRGHATRVRAIVETLRHEHEIVLFAPDEAHDLLASAYPPETGHVEVRRIPGLRFHYTRGRLDLTRSIACGLGFLWKLRGLIDQIKRAIDEEQPHLAIADFEPALPRAARACGVPVVSLNHQHFLIAYDLASLPVFLRGYAALMGCVVRAHDAGQVATIVSSFFRAPLRRGYEHVVQVGPLLRPELKLVRATRGEYLVSYLRKNSPPRVLDLLAASQREVRVYGLGERPPLGPLRFRPLNEQAFVSDLAGCAAVVGAAGNQTLGESLYFGKPVLALPEGQHHEQLINAHFLKSMGAGDWITVEAALPKHLAQFLGRLDEFQKQALIHLGRLDGTAQALAAIQRFLPRGARSQASRESQPVAEFLGSVSLR